ncbi:hypothetical protein Syun_027590 [Stephania yunnanensis]|uniref:Uncharacterized protein n=1 Tax=Stephania yunnanensis TaxID=152371 RepID=A0AAP0EPQ8_9MAGN
MTRRWLGARIEGLLCRGGHEVFRGYVKERGKRDELHVVTVDLLQDCGGGSDDDRVSLSGRYQIHFNAVLCNYRGIGETIRERERKERECANK